MARRRIIAGNWKMNKTPDEAKAVEAQKQEEEDDLALLEEDI